MKPTEKAPEPDADRIERIVATILDADEFDTALSEACSEHPDDAARIRRVVAMLDRRRLLSDPDSSGQTPGGGVIAGFEILDTLGRGGMGVVYRARDTALGREVALKVLRPELLHFEDSRERFRREIEAVARVRHPGIVAVHHAGESDGVPFFTMELVEGTSLATVIDGLRGRPFVGLRGSDVLGVVGQRADGSGTASRPLAESWIGACVQIARMVAEALEHAHERGVYHRDVKPSNVLIDEHGRARLVDFGLARLDDAQALTRSTSVVGSLPYVPPEQIEGRLEEHGARQDVYSLGVTLYEMLTLRSAFQGSSAEETRHRVVAADAPRPRQLHPTIPRDVETICLTAMDRDPQRRYASAREFAEDLDRVLSRRPIRARPASLALRTWRSTQRHPTVAVAIVLGGLLVVASSVAALNATLRAETERTARTQLVDSNLAFVFEFAQGLRRIPGNTEVRVELLRRGAAQLAELEDDPLLDVKRLGAIGEAHLALARVLGRPDSTNIGEQEVARERYEHVRNTLGPMIAGRSPAAAALLRGRAATGLAVLLQFAGELERALALQRETVEEVTDHLVTDPTTTAERALEQLYLSTQSRLAALAGSQGRHSDALRGFEALRDRYRRSVERNPDDAGAQRSFAHACSNVGRALCMLREPARAAEEYEVWIRWLDASLTTDPKDAVRAFERVRGAINYPEILIQAGRTDDAIDEARFVLSLIETLARVDTQDASLESFRMVLLYDLGWAFKQRAESAIEGGATVDSVDVTETLREGKVHLQTALEIIDRRAAAGTLQAGIKRDRVTEKLEAIDGLLGDR